MAVEFIAAFAVFLAATAIVTLLWNVIGHDRWSVDWDTSFRFASVLAVILPPAARGRSPMSRR